MTDTKFFEYDANAVTKLVAKVATKDMAILDYGATKEADQANLLKQLGFTGVYSFGLGIKWNLSNHLDYANMVAMTFDVVFCSGQFAKFKSLEEMATRLVILSSISNGVIIIDYPELNRASGVSELELLRLCYEIFGHYNVTSYCPNMILINKEGV
jgi:hypothetical protein